VFRCVYCAFIDGSSVFRCVYSVCMVIEYLEIITVFRDGYRVFRCVYCAFIDGSSVFRCVYSVCMDGYRVFRDYYRVFNVFRGDYVYHSVWT